MVVGLMTVLWIIVHSALFLPTLLVSFNKDECRCTYSDSDMA
jgi:hypothetical protein